MGEEEVVVVSFRRRSCNGLGFGLRVNVGREERLER